MSKQHQNNSTTKQETQLKNRNKGVIAGVLLLSFVVIGTLTFENTFSGNQSPNVQSTTSTFDQEVNAEIPEELQEDLFVEEEVNEQQLDEDMSRVEVPEEKQEVFQETQAPQSKERIVKPVAKTTASRARKSVTSSVQWAGMKASIEGGDAMIRWTTADEQNTNYFEIERSIDDEVFESIGRISGKDLASFHERNYAFADSSLKFVGMPRIYYKINQVGLDGKTHSSEVYEYDLGLNLDLYLRVEEIKDGMLTVSYASDKEGKASVSVLTPSGKVLYEEEVEVGFIPKRRKMDASIWGQGVYLLVLFDKNTRVTEMLEISD